MNLTEEEQDWINSNQDKCETCGHLEIFHTSHCCTFCLVAGCKCYWGELDDSE